MTNILMSEEQIKYFLLPLKQLCKWHNSTPDQQIILELACTDLLQAAVEYCNRVYLKNFRLYLTLEENEHE